MYANNTTLNSGMLSGRRSWFVQQAEKRLEGHIKEYAFVSFDVCDFKIINLIFGHDTGNRMLGFIYNAIDKAIGPGEVVVRDTADVFYALFHTQNKEAILERLYQIRRNLDAVALVDADYSPYLEMRFGVYLPNDPEESVEKMLEYANMARKHSPRELILSEACFYDKSRVRDKLMEKERVAHLIEALEQDQFVVYLQPKVSLTTNRIAGAEALVRWRRPNVGVVAPGDFIPLLERYRLVHRIDIFVFEQVCQMLARWQEEGRQLYPISVNLSRQTLEIQNLLKHFAGVCMKYGVSPSYIELEITESSAIGNFEKVRRFITELKHIGFRCSLDDFGFGYSSLGCLNELKVDSVKLDKSFFDNLNTSEKSRVIVAAMTNLGRALGCCTVAEGIEDAEQLHYLKQPGCDLVQGYLFYRPMAIEDFELRTEEEGRYGISPACPGCLANATIPAEELSRVSIKLDLD